MIHCYTSNGYYIVLDVNSGAVHCVDELTYALLTAMEPPFDEEKRQRALTEFGAQYDEQTVCQAWDELNDLVEQGLLYSADDYEPIAQKIGQVAPVKALCLHVAHDCNLRCEYCFAGTGDFHQGRLLMPLEVARAAIDFVVRESGQRRNIEIDFFGGEPLMNFDVVKETVAYARGLEQEHAKKFRFTITTNGVLLDEQKLAFINQEMSNLVLSVDGRREVNDRVRATISGGGCYDLIMPKLKQAAQSRNQTNYYVRGTFTKYNLDFSRDVLHLADEGFLQTSVEPVAAPEGESYAITRADLPQIFAEYDALALEMIKRRREGRAFNFFHFMIDLSQGPCVIKRLNGCGSGNEYLAVTPEGDLYPCHQFVGMEEFCMGNVLNGSFDLLQKEHFAKNNVYTKPDCVSCWAKFYCSGGCCANNIKYAGDLNKPYEIACEMEKKRIECAIMMKIAQLEEQEVPVG